MLQPCSTALSGLEHSDIYQRKLRNAAVHAAFRCNRSLRVLATIDNLSRFVAKRQKKLGRFYQLHLAVFLAMQDLHAAFHIAEYEYISIAKLRLFHRFFQRQWLM